MSVKLDLRNKIINGSFDYWQRGTTFANVADGTYTADRWLYKKTGSMAHTISRNTTDVPSSAFGVNSLQTTVATAQASIGVSDNVAIRQRIEGNILRSIKGKNLVLTFWVKAFKPGIYCVSIRNGTNTRSYVMEYSVSTAAWEKKTLRFTHDTTGTWAYDNTLGISIVFTLAAGTNLKTTANTWANGDYLATVNQVNGVDSTSNTFQLADVCLQEDNDGQTRVPDFQLAGRDVFEELQLCQRYFEKSYDLNTTPGAVTIVNGFSGSGAADIPLFYTYKVPKRIAPNLTFYAFNGTINVLSGGFAATGTFTLFNQISSGANGFMAGFTSSWARTGHFTADAEL
jgi:hypothetical protein